MDVLLVLQPVCRIAVFGIWQFVSDILSQMVLRYYAWENLSPWGFLKRILSPHSAGGVLSSAGIQ